MIEGLVSTIIPVHNRASMLREAVESVLGQTYRPIEIIIVDDGSTDDTGHESDSLRAAYSHEIRVIHKSNGGPGLAREAGRQEARGEFIQYLDSDDLLSPEKFEKQVSSLRNRPECGVAYGKTRFLSAQATENTAWKRTGERIASMFPSFLESRWWGTSTPLYRRRVTDAAGAWTALSTEEDWEYDCRIASQNVALCYVDYFVSTERDHDQPRLSIGGSKDPGKLKDRAHAHALILRHAQNAGITEQTREMQMFARAIFLLSRQCGAAGLSEESKTLFDLARKASGEIRGQGWDFKLYRFFASIAGWSRLGRIACYSDFLRHE
jgi:glycosyltransferase involved in cell wall biosynthesis